MDVVIRNLIHDDADGEGGPANAAAGSVQTDSDGMIDFAALLETNEDWAAINPLPSTGRETLVPSDNFGFSGTISGYIQAS